MTRFVDREAALGLLSAVGDDEHRGRFVHDFINLWETRSQRLMKALGIRDFEDADVVCLSIRSSSTMLGAWPLEAIAGMVHTAVKQQDLAGCMTHLARLHEVGRHTCAELLELLESLKPAGSGQSSSEAARR
ncbi:hypothetical protein SCB71_15965 [Herbiconiux sp. KACC 21604]|uniref:hypothetical protein n=1 Tax=unclassified Herbiconiux TaxID=2618217 RepID=UPI001492DC64|nr:hypothetical protein [Herbiconiux sp. SALV-R1]QJU54615.1 hypothetical protein HL652_13915 [Herbiconiux sp. SALV-R1]WPO85702.1 hypothetical protein SCB71_15965 [Herbiconiux sp. KACC 21604]